MDVFWRLLGIAVIIFSVFGGIALCMDASNRNKG